MRAESFEIVGVQSTRSTPVTATGPTCSRRCSTLKAASPATVIKPTTEFRKTFGCPARHGQAAEKKAGLLFFKVDRGSTGALTLTFNRPAYKVSTTGKAIPAAAISKPLG